MYFSVLWAPWDECQGRHLYGCILDFGMNCPLKRIISQKMTNARDNFPQPVQVFHVSYVYATNSLKRKDILFDKEKILTSESWNQKKNHKIVADYFSVDRLINWRITAALTVTNLINVLQNSRVITWVLTSISWVYCWQLWPKDGCSMLDRP